MSKIVSFERARAAHKAEELGDLVDSVSVFSGERGSMDELTIHAMEGCRPGEIIISIGSFDGGTYRAEAALSVSASSVLNMFSDLKQKLEQKKLI